jgi:hypothetical protein
MLANASSLLLAPVHAAILMRELETTSIRVAHIKATRRRRVRERSPNFASEALRALEHVVEASPVDVECDFVRVVRRTARFGQKEHEQRLAQSDRAVLALQLLGAGQLKVEAPQTIWVRCAKGQVVDPENSHGTQSRARATAAQGDIPKHSRI